METHEFDHEIDNDIARQHQDEAAHAYLSSFPIGYRFKPLDHELIYYLRPMINGLDLPINLMHRVNIYNHNPDYLAAKYRAQGEKIWYFLTSRDRKYPNGKRPNRKADDGYWKATGADKAILHVGREIGFRKALVFCKGKPPKGDKTPWIMHEFRVSDPSQVNKRKRVDEDSEDTRMRLDDYVLCRIYKNDNEYDHHFVMPSTSEQPLLPQPLESMNYFDHQPDDWSLNFVISKFIK